MKKILFLIKSLFKKKAETDTKINVIATEINGNKIEMFVCHYCHTKFEVDKKQLFSTSVRSVSQDYYFQGIGIQCPNCKKVCIY